MTTFVEFIDPTVPKPPQQGYYWFVEFIDGRRIALREDWETRSPKSNGMSDGVLRVDHVYIPAINIRWYTYDLKTPGVEDSNCVEHVHMWAGRLCMWPKCNAIEP